MDPNKTHATEMRWPSTDEITAEGRNGIINTSGLQVRAYGPHPQFAAKIQLRPITGKGVHASRCNIEIPYTPEALGELATFFAFHHTQALALKFRAAESADETAANPASSRTRQAP